MRRWLTYHTRISSTHDN